jgi:hypothetical protein
MHPHPQAHPQPGGGREGVFPRASSDPWASQPPYPSSEASQDPYVYASSQGIMPQESSHSSVQIPSSQYFQGFDANGIAIGTLVIGKQVYMDDPTSMILSPPSMPQLQQSIPPWQPSCSLNLPSTPVVSQQVGSVSIFVLLLFANPFSSTNMWSHFCFYRVLLTDFCSSHTVCCSYVYEFTGWGEEFPTIEYFQQKIVLEGRSAS